jgi:hypothetical protein
VNQNDPPQQLSNGLPLANGGSADSLNHWFNLQGCFLMRYHDKTKAERYRFASIWIGILTVCAFVFALTGDYLLGLVGL